MNVQRFLITLVLFLLCAVSNAAKVDSVYLQNGNIITGEVKALELGKLSYKTDDMGTLKIEWDKIRSIESHQNFFIKMVYGTIYYGSLDTSGVPGVDLVVMALDTFKVNHMDVVLIQQRKKTFWENVDGYASVGFNFTKTNNDAQLSGDLDVKHKGTSHNTDLSSSVIIKSRDSIESTLKQVVNLNHYRTTSGRLFWGGNLGYEKNSELNLKSRLKLAAFGGSHIILTNFSQLSWLGGAVGNTEVAMDTHAETYNLEGVIGLNFHTYRYDDPELDISASASLYQVVNDLERRRIDVQAKVRWEVFNDFFFSLSFYNNFDSKPPSTETIQNDFGLVSSIGYSF